jgi:hypothetical protein
VLAQLIERVVTQAAARADELVAARDDWDARAGKVYDDDPLYEERSGAFLEWFALERRGSDGRSPVERLIATLPADDPDRVGFALLARTHRSLFAVRAVNEQRVELDDLLGGGLFRVFERRQPLGLQEGDIFEARLCARPDASGEVLLTKAIQHHPREARAALEEIAVESRRLAEPRETVLFRIAKLRWKAARWGHVQPDRIYRGEDAAE